MKEPIFKIVLTGELFDLEMYEIEPGKLFISLFDPADEQAGGWIELPTKAFMDAVNKLLAK